MEKGSDIKLKEEDWFGVDGLSPDSDGTVPAGGADSGTVRRGSQAADAVLVAVENRVTDTFQRIPDADSVVSITGEQDATCNRNSYDHVYICDGSHHNFRVKLTTETEINAVDREKNWLFLVDTHLTVGTEIEEAALKKISQNTSFTDDSNGSIVGSSGKGVSVRMESDCIYVCFVSFERLHTLSRSDIPDQWVLVGSSWDERVASVTFGNVNREDVSGVSVEVLDELSALHVPDGTRRVSTSRQYQIIGAEKCAAWHIWGMRCDLSLLLDDVIFKWERHDTAFIVETSENLSSSSRKFPESLTRKQSSDWKERKRMPSPKSSASSARAPC